MSNADLIFCTITFLSVFSGIINSFAISYIVYGYLADVHRTSGNSLFTSVLFFVYVYASPY